MQRDTPRVLIVDDEAIIRKVLMTTLAQAGYKTSEADSGESALTILRQQKFDIVISDITMAKVSGIDLLFTIKEISPETEVILITAYASLETAEAAVAGKAYRYLRKPLDDIEDVLKVVEEALSTQRQYKKKEAQFAELICQRNRLQRQVGQLETMYAISHASGFPESPASLIKEIACLLSRVIPLVFMGCSIQGDPISNFGGLFLVALSPFQDNVLTKLIKTLQQELGQDSPLTMEKVPLHNIPPIEKLGKLIEITFPQGSRVKGMLYVGFAQDITLASNDSQLLEVAAAQIAGAIGKLSEFHSREHERLQLLIEGMTDGVILLKPGNHVGLTNQAVFALLGAKTIVDLEEQIQKLGWLGKSNVIPEDQWTLNKEMELDNGKIVSVTILPLGNHWEATATIVVRDITQQKRLEQELDRSRRLSYIGEMAAGVVHEINTPLSLILGYSQLVVTAKVPEEVRGDMEKIVEAAERCQQIVRNVLELAPSQNRCRTLTNVTELIDKVLTLNKHALHQAKIKVIKDYPAEDIWIFADPGEIQEVLLNLIKNAQDAMDGQENVQTLEISVRAIQDRVQMAICDSGPGISEKNMQKLFNPFFTTKPPGKGSGLGLSISHRIIHEHGGTIWCNNKPSGGAAFTIELPITQPKKENV